MKRIVILGSTGSIGKSTLQVVKKHESFLKVVALAAHSNLPILIEQIQEFTPEIVAVFDVEKAKELKQLFPALRIVSGIAGLKEVAQYENGDIVVSAIAGTLGIEPTVAAIQAGKDIALANKEVLVSGGSYVTQLVKEKRVKLLPVDSEHSAIFQCLQGNDIREVRRIILTSSGGPFLKFSSDELKNVSVSHALNHPNWKMGPKVTIDSSTLMNKGLEVIEAHFLFELPLDQIEVVIHPQSIIHSMVEFIDGSIMAQMSVPNMILPIQYALTYPKREEGLLKPFDFIRNGKLEFALPDFDRFSCLKIAFSALKEGKSYPCYMNGANEILVDRFLKEKIHWQEISAKLDVLMQRHSPTPVNSLEEILEIDANARRDASVV